MLEKVLSDLKTLKTSCFYWLY